METSATIGKIAGALAKAQGAMRPAAFNKTNPHYKSKYADLTACIESAKKALADNGLSVVQEVTSQETLVSVTTILSHAESGEWFRAITNLKASKADAQGVGSGFTYGRRYAFCAMLGISADEDDDGNGAAIGGTGQRAVEPKIEAKENGDPKRAFAESIRQWSGVAPEDLGNAARDACKKLGVDPKTVSDWPKLCQMIADAREVFGSFQEWIASKE